MFIHQNQLEYRLKPSAYTSQAHFERERELFLANWQLVAVREELANDGDFVTRDYFGIPLILRNFDGQIHAFLNVCSHRHCELTSEPAGNSPTLKCQYHGWEYKADGFTARIPEARCFRPFDRETARLQSFPVSTCGDLIFVRLDGKTDPSLEEHLGEFFPICEEMSTEATCAYIRERPIEANWKIVVENNLENYHFACLHPKTFGGTPPVEEDVEHMLEELRTRLITPAHKGKLGWLNAPVTRLFGHVPHDTYSFCSVHPNFLFARSDVTHVFEVPIADAPNRTRFRYWIFVPKNRNRNPLTWPIQAFLRKGLVLASRQVIKEDVSIFPRVQKGLESSPYPGCIGTREERVYCFHTYILNRCGNGDGPPPSHVPDRRMQATAAAD